MNATRQSKGSKRLSSLEQIKANAAGIDIGATEHWVCVPADRTAENVRCFGCFTPDLKAMADWLIECGVETVAMESTSVDWIPPFQILEARGLEVFLVNAHQVKNVPGRKSDVLDCQWLQQLHTYGLLSHSFIPEDQIGVLRSYLRQRENLIKNATTHIQRMHKALTQMNVQLHKVISDVTGVTGMAIIRALVAGERNPEKLASLADKRIKSSQAEIVKALTGNYRAEQVFILQQELALYDFYQQQMAALDVQIEQCLASFPTQVEGPPPERTAKKPRAPRGNQPSFDLRSHLYRKAWS